MITTAASNIPKAFERDLEQAVKILKGGGCAEVFLFGSLVQGGGREDSDVDLAVRGCPPESFFRLYGELMSVLDHRVDLVDLDNADPFTEYLTQKGTLLQLA
jgi:predicted nucleotidyltransferase